MNLKKITYEDVSLSMQDVIKLVNKLAKVDKETLARKHVEWIKANMPDYYKKEITTCTEDDLVKRFAKEKSFPDLRQFFIEEYVYKMKYV